jgi:hypothetical protein
MEEPSKIMGHNRVNIIEGSYSLHPYFGDVYDLKVFMDVDNISQRNNIRKRDGEEKFIRFTNEWIPKENAYFDKFVKKEECVVIKWN